MVHIQSVAGPIFSAAVKGAISQLTLSFDQLRKEGKERPASPAVTAAIEEISRELGRRGEVTTGNITFLQSLYTSQLLEDIVVDSFFRAENSNLRLTFLALYSRYTGKNDDDGTRLYRQIRNILSTYIDHSLGKSPLHFLITSTFEQLNNIRNSRLIRDEPNQQIIKTFDQERENFIARMNLYKEIGSTRWDVNQTTFIDTVRRTRPWFFVTDGEIADVIETYSKRLIQETERISVFGPRGIRMPANFDDIYVEPDLQALVVVDQKSGAGTLEAFGTVGERPANFVRPGLSTILGHPGVGKSSLSRYLIRAAAGHDSEPWIPCFIQLRKFVAARKSRPTLTLLDFSIEQISSVCAQIDHSVVRNVILFNLFFGRTLYIFDGLDEILSQDVRTEIAGEIADFSRTYERGIHIVTSRLVGYDPRLFITARHFRIREFDEIRIRSYVDRASQHILAIEPAKRADFTNRFLEQALRRADELARIPLLLALMTVLYEARGHELPDQRFRIYEECSLLLFHTWDDAREINPDLPDRFRMRQLLIFLSQDIFEDQALQGGVSHSWLVDRCTTFFKLIYGGDHAKARYVGEKFTDYITDRAWVLSLVGANTYEFTHRTFLEYFYAESLSERIETLDQLFEHILPWIRKGQQTVVSHLCLQKQIGDSLGKSEKVIDRLTPMLRDSPTTDRQNIATFLSESIDYVAPTDTKMKEIISIFTSLATDTPEWRQTLYRVLRRAGRNRNPVFDGVVEGLAIATRSGGGRSLASVYDFLYAAKLRRAGLIDADILLDDVILALNNRIQSEVTLTDQQFLSGPACLKLRWDCFNDYTHTLLNYVPQAWDSSIRTLNRADWLAIDARSCIMTKLGLVTPEQGMADAFNNLFHALGKKLVDESGPKIIFPTDRLILTGPHNSLTIEHLTKGIEEASGEDLLGWVACLGLLHDYQHHLSIRDELGIVHGFGAPELNELIRSLCGRAISSTATTNRKNLDQIARSDAKFVLQVHSFRAQTAGSLLSETNIFPWQP